MAHATAGRIIERAAAHLARVGLHHGEAPSPLHPGDSRKPCSALAAFYEGVRSARPTSMSRDASWDAFDRARTEALRILSDGCHGSPLTPEDAPFGWDLDRYRTIVILIWGEREGLTTQEAVNAFRAAAGLAAITLVPTQEALWEPEVQEPSQPSGESEPGTRAARMRGRTIVDLPLPDEIAS